MSRAHILFVAALAAALPAARAAAPFHTEVKGALIRSALDAKTVAELKSLGIDGVEMNLMTKTLPTLEAARAARALAEREGLTVTSTLGGWFAFNEPEKYADELEKAKRCIELTKAYGASVMLLVPVGFYPENGPKFPPFREIAYAWDPETLAVSSVTKGDNAPYADYIRRQNAATAAAVKAIRALVPLAAREGVVLALENVGSRMWMKSDYYHALVKSFQSPWVKFYFDMGNSLNVGDPCDWIDEMGADIVRVHLKDDVLDPTRPWGQRMVPIGTGALDFGKIRARLDKIGYNGWVTVESAFQPDAEHARILKAFSGGNLRPAPAPMTYRRTEDSAPFSLGTRPRVTDRPWLYAETIPSYGQYQNFLHHWIDRPLFTDRALRPDLGRKFQYDTKESFAVSQREVLACGMNGLATFGNFSTRLLFFKDYCRWLEESGRPGFNLMPVMLYGESGMDGMPPLDKFAEFIRFAQSTKVTPELNGKKFIATYNTRCQSIETHRKVCAALRERVGNDRYLLVGDYPHRDIEELRNAFHRRGGLSAAEVLRLEKMTTDLLDIFDGLHLRSYEYLREPDGPYASTVDMSFFDTCVKPVLLDVYARPQYRGKLFGLYVIQGYVNCHSGMNHAEDGTAALRRMLRSAAALNPDFLVFFEWNEQNENTMFQPTLYSGKTVGRLVKWYADFANGRPAAPYPGDDRAVPDLVLSHRVVYKPGEEIRFEILNIPCGEEAPAHTVRLSLLDEDGKSLVDFPTERLATDRLASVTYAVPGEAFAVGSSLTPVLTVDGVSYGGFHPVRSDATVCANYKDVRQSLRDGLIATKGDLRVTRLGEGRYRCAVDAAFGEKLASLELVCNENELAAYDPSGEYDPAKCDILSLSLSAAPGTTGGGQVEVTFADAEGLAVTQDWKADVNPGAVVWQSPGKALLETHWWTRPCTYFLRFPKGKAAAATATVKVLTGKHAGGRAVTVPFAQVMTGGVWAAEANSATGFRVDAARVTDLPDLPRAPDVAAAAWTCEVETTEPNPTFHLRAIARSGKIWRSKAVRPPVADGRPPVALSVFSERRRGLVPVDVPAGQIRELVYRFAPEGGDVLACSDSRFNATLGGGYAPGSVFESASLLKAAPDRALAPKWVAEDGRWLLRFDGVNDYVNFPIETVPLGPFTLTMEIRPDANPTNTVLFRHGSGRRGTLALFVVNGELYAIWPNRVYDWTDKGHSLKKFPTGLKVASGEWNEIVVSYDIETLTVGVNGARKAFPLGERGYRYSPSVFGGHARRDDIAPPGPLAWFKGDLRKLTVSHRKR